MSETETPQLERPPENLSPHTTSLYDTIQSLRSIATATYETGKAGGLTNEQLAAKLLPLTEKLEHVEDQAVERNRIDQLCHAILQFELDAEAINDHIEWLARRAEDIKHHSSKLKAKLLERMDAQKKQTVRGLLYSATAIDIINAKTGGGRSLVVR